jgi:hypothetical protein
METLACCGPTAGLADDVQLIALDVTGASSTEGATVSRLVEKVEVVFTPALNAEKSQNRPYSFEGQANDPAYRDNSS